MQGLMQQIGKLAGKDHMPAAFVVMARMLEGFLKSNKIEAAARTVQVQEVNGILRDLAERSSLPGASFAVVAARTASGAESLAFIVITDRASKQLAPGCENNP